MEHRITRSVTRSIGAPAATAWRFLADVERWPEWTPTVARVVRLDDGPLGVGARVRIRQPKLFPAVWTITEWTPERSFTWVMRSPGVRVVADHTIRPEGSGCTVELRVGYGGILGGLVARLYGGLTERYMQMEAEGLRSRIEAPA